MRWAIQQHMGCTTQQQLLSWREAQMYTSSCCFLVQAPCILLSLAGSLGAALGVDTLGLVVVGRGVGCDSLEARNTRTPDGKLHAHGQQTTSAPRLRNGEQKQQQHSIEEARHLMLCVVWKVRWLPRMLHVA